MTIAYYLYFRKLCSYLSIILRRTACLDDAVKLLPENMIEFEKGNNNEIPIVNLSDNSMFNDSWTYYLKFWNVIWYWIWPSKLTELNKAIGGTVLPPANFLDQDSLRGAQEIFKTFLKHWQVE